MVGTFCKRFREQLELEVDLVSGPEEARLIYLGVLSGMPFGDCPHLVLDIGGGSTELILADGRDARALTSTRVGAVRLQRDFVEADPMPRQRRTFLEAFIQGSSRACGQQSAAHGSPQKKHPVMVATSGTAMAIGALAASEEDRPPLKLHGYRVSKQRLDRVVDRLVVMTPEQRKGLAPINDRRAEIIVPGALILQTSMQMLGAKELVLSERALREGLIVDWMFASGPTGRPFQLSKQHPTAHRDPPGAAFCRESSDEPSVWPPMPSLFMTPPKTICTVMMAQAETCYGPPRCFTPAGNTSISAHITSTPGI